MKGLIVTLHKKKSIIEMWVRTLNGKVKVTVSDFRPYFYVTSKLGSFKSLFGERLDKIVLKDPSKVPEVREKYSKHFEADVPYTRRFLIDTNLYSGVEFLHEQCSWRDLKPTRVHLSPLTYFLDIEVLSETLPDPALAEHPVVSITIYNTWSKSYTTFFWHPKVKNTRTVKINDVKVGSAHVKTWLVKAFRSEELMLLDFLSSWETDKPDVVTGWNVNFDVSYLSNRVKTLFEKHGLKFNLEFTNVFDMLEGYKRLAPKRRSYRLKEVSVSEGLETKQEALEASEVLKTWRSDFKEVVKYNLKDVWRIVSIDLKYRIVDFFWKLKETVGLAHLTDTLHSSVLIDTLLLREAKKRNVVLPSVGSVEKKSYRGAIVFKPPKGVFENVAVFDMARYYPSLIISFNISPETKWKKVGETWLFYEEPEGLLPALARKLLEEREKIEVEMKKYSAMSETYKILELKSNVLKYLANSIYGYTAYEKSRIYDVDVASTVTALAREGLIVVSKKAEELGFKVIYGDTDSVFIQVPFEKAEELSQRLTDYLCSYFKEKYGLKRKVKLKLKFEKYYKRVFFKGVKKRYVGLLVWKKGKKTNELEIKGFEAIRTDTAPFTTYAEEKVFKAILEGKSRNEIYEIVRKLSEEAKRRPLSDIALVAGLSKELNEYKVKAPHVRAAVYSNLYLGTNFTKGSKVKYVYVKYVKGKPKTDVVAFEDESQVKDIIVVDWNKQLKAILYQPLEEILGSTYSFTHVKTVSLSRWF